MVSVPVLSTMSVSTHAIRSSASASLISTPACARRARAAVVMEIGVASPSAQGRAMMSTDTAEAIAIDQRGLRAKISQTTAKATMAMTTTVGTNRRHLVGQPWIGARTAARSTHRHDLRQHGRPDRLARRG